MPNRMWARPVDYRSSMTRQEFRATCGQFPTGVTVVTATSATGEHRGMTLSAFVSVSLDPYLVLISVSDRSRFQAALSETGRYAVSILNEDQRAVASFFAGNPAALTRPSFAFPVPSAPPVIEGALAWMHCKIVEARPAGDHVLYIGEPYAIGSGAGLVDRGPLVFSRSAYQSLSRENVELVDWSHDYMNLSRLLP